MIKRLLIVSIERIIRTIIYLIFFIFTIFLFKNMDDFLNSGVPKVAILYINNEIVSGRNGSSFLGGEYTGSEDVVDKLNIIKKNKSIKGLILRINSPGGTVGAAQEIYREIRRLKEKRKDLVIVASGIDVMASGAYYIASACDYIFANPGTIVGSIGVVMTIHNIEGAYKKIGMKDIVFKSGKFKDIGSSTRPLMPEEKRIIQGIIDDSYNQFLIDVSKGRKLDINELKKLADGRIFIGEKAKKYGLIDFVGNIVDALEYIKGILKLKERPVIIRYFYKKGVFSELLGIFRGFLGFKISNNSNISLKYMIDI